METSRKHFIISFDGGGVRMILQYVMILRVIKEFPDLLDEVDVYAGTSAGALLATYFATETKEEIFSQANLNKLFERGFGKKLLSLGGLVRSKYCSSNMERILVKLFGNRKLSSLDYGLFIPVFRATKYSPEDDTFFKDKTKPSWLTSRVPRWKPMYRHNLDIAGSDYVGDAGGNKKLVDILLETTAAPYYFPMHGDFVDGGIGNNNPSLSVVTSLISRGVKMEDIYVLSFGSGETPKYIDHGDKDWGAIQWLPHLLDMVFDASEEVTSQQCYDLLGDNFWRIQPVLPERINLDQPDKFQDLIDVANAHDLTHTFEWLEKLSGILSGNINEDAKNIIPNLEDL